MNKINDLHNLPYMENCDIVLITESFLHSGVGNGLLDPKSHYTIVRKDRLDGKGGGVCALVKNDIAVSPVLLDDHYSDLELVCFTVENIVPRLRYFLVYRPPYHDAGAVLYVSKLIDCLARYSDGLYANIIVGDLNLPKINWETSLCPDDKVHRPFLDFCICHGYTQRVDFTTNGKISWMLFCQHYFDHIICDVDCHPPIGCSNHVTITYTTLVAVKNSINVEVQSLADTTGLRLIILLWNSH